MSTAQQFLEDMKSFTSSANSGCPISAGITGITPSTSATAS